MLPDPAQIHAIDEPLDAPLALTGNAGSGKTTALILRAARAAQASSPERVLVTTPAAAGTGALAARIAELAPRAGLPVLELGPLAFSLLSREARFVSEDEAALVFEAAAADVVDEAWTTDVELDPEVSGARTPARFRLAAFRLFAKLRSAGIGVEEFEKLSRRGLAQFYGRPPNLASTDLLMRTKEQYRDSLAVDAAELERQRLRENDLIKVLAALYRRYMSGLVEAGILTAAEALLAATAALREGAIASPFDYVFVDDAQDLSPAELAFVTEIAKRSYTLASDAAQASRAFAGRAARVPEGSISTVELTVAYRAASRTTFRAPTQALEAARVAEDVAAALAAGAAPGSIAVLARGLRGITPYLDALLARGIDVEPGGDVDLFAFPAVEDALAAMWSLADPYRHDWLMRNLEAPWLNFSDATIAELCAPAPDAQPLLFEVEEPVERSPSRRRSDPGRALRLARNVLRGDADRALDPETIARLKAFRTAHARWEMLDRSLDTPALMRAIAADTAIVCARPGAAGGFDRRMLEALLEHAGRYAEQHPFETLHDYLLHVEGLLSIEGSGVRVQPRARDAVALLDIEAAKGREFDHVFIVNVRAGAFPAWYVPDAFLFYRQLGIVAKENVGEGARAARTAKFTYAMHRHSSREHFITGERRALTCAMSRARKTLTVLASGTPTRGDAAPELLEEL